MADYSGKKHIISALMRRYTNRIPVTVLIGPYCSRLTNYSVKEILQDARKSAEAHLAFYNRFHRIVLSFTTISTWKWRQWVVTWISPKTISPISNRPCLKIRLDLADSGFRTPGKMAGYLTYRGLRTGFRSGAKDSGFRTRTFRPLEYCHASQGG